MNRESISFMLETDKKEKLDAIAASLDRDRSHVLNEAIDAYIEVHQWQIEHIQKGFARLMPASLRAGPRSPLPSPAGSAYEHIAGDHPSAAFRVVERIEKAVAVLSRHPEAGRAGRIRGTRELVVSGTPFIVPYRFRRDAIQVLAVIHTSRKWPPSL